ncbi:hypothetical protein BCBMB205_39620 [Bacillus sp. CN2]|nr:hypothetical protein BCBMB205_39620 [Bacillus velezensis]ARZ60308.1 hypothetical protein BAGQ_4108 [Bacillus velezensis]GFR55387.1 hypothetical protein BCBMB205_39620 [Bacillus sp. CN2]
MGHDKELLPFQQRGFAGDHSLTYRYRLVICTKNQKEKQRYFWFHG